MDNLKKSIMAENAEIEYQKFGCMYTENRN
jgi:hypothetical protein